MPLQKKLPIRDALHAALGSPEILPSTADKVTRAFENIEENAFEDGQLWFRDHDAEALLMDVLVALEKDNGGTIIFERAKWKAALNRVLVERREREEIPF